MADFTKNRGTCAALLTAIRELVLRDQLFKREEFGVRLRGQPPAWAGQQYVGLYCHERGLGQATQMDTGWEETLGVTFAITRRVGTVPADKWEDEIYLKAISGLDDTAERIRVWVYTSWCVATGSSTPEVQEIVMRNLDLEPASQIHQPLRWTGTDPEPRIEGADWFSASPNAEGTFGLVLETRFEGFSRSVAARALRLLEK